MFNSPFPITNPHLFPGTGYSTEVIPGMFAGGPLGGGPPRCLDCIHVKRTESYSTTWLLLRLVKGSNKFAITGGSHLINVAQEMMGVRWPWEEWKPNMAELEFRECF